jgi:hypothetical protein
MTIKKVYEIKAEAKGYALFIDETKVAMDKHLSDVIRGAQRRGINTEDLCQQLRDEMHWHDTSYGHIIPEDGSVYGAYHVIRQDKYNIAVTKDPKKFGSSSTSYHTDFESAGLKVAWLQRKDNFEEIIGIFETEEG